MRAVDFGAFGLVAAPSITETPVFRTQLGHSRPAAAGKWFFTLRGAFWTASGGEWNNGELDGLNLTEIGAQGEVLGSLRLDLRRFGYETFGWVAGVTGDSLGRVWVALSLGYEQTDLLCIDLATQELVMRVPTPHVEHFHTDITSHEDRIYLFSSLDQGAQSLLAFDVENGAVAKDFMSSAGYLLRMRQFEGRHIAVNNGTLLIRGEGGEALAFALQDGDFLGVLADVPGGPLTSGDGFFWALSAHEAISFQMPASPMRNFALLEVLAFQRTGAHSLAHHDGIVWIFYEGEGQQGELIAYDPDDFTPIQGVTISADALRSAYAETESGVHQPFGFAVTDTTFVFESTTIDSLFMGLPKSSSWIFINKDDGEVQSTFTTVGVSATSICSRNNELWALFPEEMRSQTLAGSPALLRIDPDNGRVLQSVQTSIPVTGFPSLLCNSEGFRYGADQSHHWASFQNENETPQLAAFSLPNAGASVTRVGTQMWMLDRKRNLIFVVDARATDPT